MSRQLDQIDSLIYIYRKYAETLPPIQDNDSGKITRLTIHYLQLLKGILRRRERSQERQRKYGVSRR